MKRERFLRLADLFYRVRTLVNGPVTPEELDQILDRHLYSYGDRPFFQRLMLEAYQRELLSYVTALDARTMRTVDDPFLTGSLISNYEREFRELAARETYRPGGIINTELLVLYSLIRHVKPDVFIESGTMNAYSSLFIAEALQRNGGNPRLHCLSLFQEGQCEAAKLRLKPFEFASVHEGPSEVIIDRVADAHGDERVAMLIDGPKARTAAWDVLTAKVADRFSRLLFLCFDSAQEHVPFWSLDGAAVPLKRSLNVERLKIVKLYEQSFAPRKYFLTIQSNQFCRSFHYLNEKNDTYRNERWGKSFPWGPYRVDCIENHVAHSYKLATIYSESISFP